jgi:hypothetical protein
MRYEDEVAQRKPFDRLSLLLSIDAPVEMMADIAADKIEELRSALKGVVASGETSVRTGDRFSDVVIARAAYDDAVKSLK